MPELFVLLLTPKELTRLCRVSFFIDYTLIKIGNKGTDYNSA